MGQRFIKYIRLFWPLLCILIVAGTIRFIDLGRLPFGFHIDELSAGYIGRYIFLHNGFDITGHRFPLYYDSFGDFRPIGIFLLSGASTFLFGVNEFAVRFPSAFFGLLTIIPMYILCVWLLKNRMVALLASLFMALSPWHVVLSRATSEPIVGLFFLLTGIVSLFYFAENGSWKIAGLGIVNLALSYMFYHTYRALVPFVLIPLCFYPKLHVKRKYILFSVFALFLCLTVLFSLTSSGSGRFRQVMITNSPTITNNIAKFTQGEGSNNILTARIFHNKVIVYVREFLRLYADYFSPTFLFSQGGLPDRYVVPDIGLFPWVFVVFLGMGLIVILTKRSFAHKFLLWLFFIAPLPAAITFEDIPNVHRAICLMIPLIITSAIGVVAIFDIIRKKGVYRIGIVVFTMLFLSETVYFWHQYSVHERAYKSYFRNDMYREMIREVAKTHSDYDVVYMPQYGNMMLYFLFYTDTFNNLPSGIFTPDGDIKKFDNILFVDTWCPTQVKGYRDQNKDVLYVDRGDCLEDPQYRIIRSLTQHDGARAFYFAQQQIIDNGNKTIHGQLKK